MIEDARIGQRVRGSGMEGTIIELNIGNPSGVITIVDDHKEVGFDHAALFEPVSDPCQSCEKAATITGQCKQIAEEQQNVVELCKSANGWAKIAGERGEKISELQIERDGWKSAAEAYSSLKDDYRARLTEARRTAAYWREELEKLQKDAPAECDSGKKLTDCCEILKYIPECTQHGAWCPDHMIDWIKARKHEEEERIAECDRASLGEAAKIYIQISPAVLAQIMKEREE